MELHRLREESVSLLWMLALVKTYILRPLKESLVKIARLICCCLHKIIA